ncbi:MAG: bifunctional phosphoglucose/phosphomannose isomerase [Candidatus Nealsonbacteria bacterium]
MEMNLMKKIILDFPRQFEEGLEAAEKIRTKGAFDKIIICGMGGSALPGDLLKIAAEELEIKLPIHIHRNYGLPYFADKNSLIICISYSGNTEETVSAFMEAVKRKIKILAITSGGELTNLCQKDRIPVAIVPKGYQPRMALGFQFASLIKILANCQLTKDCSKTVSLLKKGLNPKSLEDAGKRLAEKLYEKTPIIYASEKFEGLTRVWKNKINESAKTLCLINLFPEINHNELSGFINPQGKFHLLVFRDKKDNPRILKRIDLTVEIIEQMGTKADIIEISGNNIFLKIFSNIILGDWMLYYLSEKYGVDPIKIQLQEDFKKRLNKN